MPVSKKQQASVNKYIANHYDRVLVTFKAGYREKLKSVAASRNESVNAFITSAVDDKLHGRAASSCDSSAPGDMISPETLAKIKNHLGDSAETIPDFINRAVVDTIQRDRLLHNFKKP